MHGKKSHIDTQVQLYTVQYTEAEVIEVRDTSRETEKNMGKLRSNAS